MFLLTTNSTTIENYVNPLVTIFATSYTKLDKYFLILYKYTYFIIAVIAKSVSKNAQQTLFSFLYITKTFCFCTASPSLKVHFCVFLHFILQYF